MMNLENLKITRATPKDVFDIIEIRRQGWLCGYKKDLSEKDIKQFFALQNEQQNIEKSKNYLASNNHNCFLANYENKNVGLFWFEDNDRKISDDCYVYGFYVLPEFQHKGIGSLLWEFGLKQMREKGYKTCSLITTQKNEKSKNFYKLHNGKVVKQYVEEMIAKNENSKVLVDEFCFKI